MDGDHCHKSHVGDSGSVGRFLLFCISIQSVIWRILDTSVSACFVILNVLDSPWRSPIIYRRTYHPIP